jgi:hypothetical protein
MANTKIKTPRKVKWNINSIMIKVSSEDFIEHKNLCWFFFFFFFFVLLNGCNGKN